MRHQWAQWANGVGRPICGSALTHCRAAGSRAPSGRATRVHMCGMDTWHATRGMDTLVAQTAWGGESDAMLYGIA